MHFLFTRRVVYSVGGLSLLGIASAVRGSIDLSSSATDYALNAPVTSQIGTYQGLAQFDASNAVDGNVTEPTTGLDSGQFEWLSNNGDLGDNFTIDLGSSKSFTEIDLYNTHNGSWNDRGTANFTVDGSNTIDGTGQLVNPTTILTGTLSATNGESPITPQDYTTLDSTGPFRYIRFTENTFYTNGGGLNEIAIGVPEPVSASLLCVVGASLVLRRRR